MSGPSRPCAALALVALLAALLISGPAAAQRGTGAPLPNKPDLGPIGESINSNTIAIVSGNTNTTYLSIAYDLSAVLDDGDAFRILPLIGMGGGQNIKDVRYLKGVDIGITQSAILNAYKASREIGFIDDKIVYIAKLFDEEMHVIVRADSGITMIDQLAGRKVNFSDVGSGTQLAARDVFGKLEIAVQEINIGQADAIEKLMNKEIAATILIAGKPEVIDTEAQGRGRAAHAAGAIPQGASRRLPARELVGRGLSGADRAEPDDRHRRGRCGADRLQLAAGHGPLPARPEIRRYVFLKAGKLSDPAPPSEVEGGQSRGDHRRLEAF